MKKLNVNFYNANITSIYYYISIYTSYKISMRGLDSKSPPWVRPRYTRFSI